MFKKESGVLFCFMAENGVKINGNNVSSHFKISGSAVPELAFDMSWQT
jgi:hypothetical protein